MLASEILRIIPQYIRVIRRLSARQLTESITFNHLRILSLVDEGQRQSQMAQTLQISLPAISKMVHGLEAKKLIHRTPGEDKRSHALRLTAKGKRILNAVTLEVEKDVESALKKLSPSELQELKQTLSVMNKLMSYLKEV